MSTTSASTAPAPREENPSHRLARAELFRFVAACYYEPGPEFVEERLFDSMCAAAERLDPDLARRARRLADAFARQPLEELLVDYTRLFLGPGPVAAQPYARVWMNGEQPILPMYAEAGLEMDEGFRDLPDHITAELEFLYVLIYQGGPENLRQRFLKEQLGPWVRPFTHAVKGGAETAFYRELAELTERMVTLEGAR
jgi:TorA maturation chaperone TorD